MFSTTQRVKRLQALIEKDGSNQGAHYMLGEEYLRENYPMKAAVKFRRVIELNPDHVDAWKMMATSFLAAGVPKEAAVAYDNAARLLTLNGHANEAGAMRDAATQARKTAVDAGLAGISAGV